MLTLTAFVNAQQTSTASAFVNYASKTTLLASNSNFMQAHASNKQFIQQLQTLKQCFCFSAHVSNKYLVVTMYSNSEKKYTYYVLDCTTQAFVQQTSVKTAKQYVIAQYAQAQQAQAQQAQQAQKTSASK